jgi:2-C-methyl-D-erythritol 2,4-cyclodiphosphate synthase
MPALLFMFRIGIGNDTHRLVGGRPLVLGGVEVPYELGAAGHSDSDALAHAVIDAMLGAMADGDIGVHFPDRDPKWKDANSFDMLVHVVRRADARGFHVVNADTTVMLERPKLREYIAAMRVNIARALNVDVGCVSVKAKTGEGLDAVGRGEAVSAQAIVLLSNESN